MKKYIYKRYHVIKNRCDNKNAKDYKYYGGKGIKLRIDFNDFYDWYIENIGRNKDLTIGRINHNKNYTIDNIRAESINDQVSESNTRNSKKIKVISKKLGETIAIFNSSKAAEEFYLLKEKYVNAHCKRKYKSCRKHKSIYFRYL